MAAARQDAGRADGTLFEFGPFRFDLGRRLLTRDGVPVPLSSRPLDILQILVGRAPALVSKATLVEQVWRGGPAKDSTLRYHIWTLRKALGDLADDGRYISTASNQGYCFVAPLTPLSVPGPAAFPADETGDEPIPVMEPPVTNLPLRLTEIVGRSRELAELEIGLAQGRLVTLVGPGGVGKTRLAIEVGWLLLDHYAGGVWLIDLAPLGDADALTSAVAASLGVSVTETEAATGSIITALGSARRLLIFDNCEHLAEDAAALIKLLLERAPGVSILATSQTPLQLAAETVYGLDPLAVPPPDAPEIEGFAAVELFVRRAHAANRLFTLHRDNREAIGDICRQLDGLPLAVEMAAGRLRLLGVDGLQRGLADRLKLLKGAPDGDARHASLTEMLDWSHSLLAPTDQAVFRRLAVFPTGFSLEAAIAVAGEDEARRWTVVDALGRLIDQSLVTIERREPARYRLLQTMRFYAMDKLWVSGEADAVAERHARHFVQIFDAAEAAWEATPDVDWIARYRPELDNLRVGLDWALAVPARRQIAVALARSGLILLRSLWLTGEGLRYQDRLLPLLGVDTTAASTARLFGYASSFYHLAGDPKGLPLAERAAVLFRQLRDWPGLAGVLMTIAQYRMWQGRHADAKGLILEAEGLLADGTARKSQVRLTVLAGLVSFYTDDIPNARRHLAAGVESAKRWRPGYEAVPLVNLGNVECSVGNIARAIELTSAALSCETAALGPAYRGFTLTNLASYLLIDGQVVEARRRLEAAFPILVETGNISLADFLQPWAVLAGIEGRLVEAAQLIGATDADLARRGQIMSPTARPLYNRLMAILDDGLPSAERDGWKAEGARWSPAEAIDFVASRLKPAG